MNFRTTTLLFGMLLGILMVFGLMLSLRRSALDQGYVFPKFREAKDKVISVEISKDGKELLFTQNKDGAWYLTVPPNKQQIRVLDKKVEGLIDEIRGAKHSNDEVPELTNDLEKWGLTSPKTTVILKDTEGLERKLFVGKESGDNKFVFVNSNERKRDVLAVSRSSISSVFSEPDDFRSRTLLDTMEATPKRIALKEPRDPKVTPVVLKNTKGKLWRFEQPPLGPAEFESKAGATSTDNSVNGLIRTLGSLRVEEFEPLGSAITVEADKAALSVELDVESTGDDKKAKGKQILLIGDKVRDKDLYYARLDGEGADKSVVRVNSKQLEPVFAILKDPKPLRSRDVAQFDPGDVDAVEISRGKDEYAKLFKFPENWKVYASGSDAKTANDTSITGPTGLLQSILGRGEIKEKDFEDTDKPEKMKELEAKFANADRLDGKVMVWSDSFVPPKKDESKEAKKEDQKDTKKDEPKDTKKDQPKETKKDEPKDTKKDEPKKEEAKKDEGKETKKDESKDAKKDDKVGKDDKNPPKFKAGVKPVVTLSFVKLDKDKMLVKREAPESDPMYFSLATAAYEKMVPPEMALAFIDTTIPTFNFFDAFKLELVRGTAKERETFLLERELPKAKDESKKEEGKKDEPKKDEAKKGETSKDQPKKDEKKEDKVNDWKLKEPKEAAGKEVDQHEVDSVLSQVAGLHVERWVRKVSKEGLAEFGLDVPNLITTVTYKKKDGDKEETKTFSIKIGNKSRIDKDKGGYYAIEGGTDIVFVIDSHLEKTLEDAEFRDRQVLKFEPKDVKEVQFWILSKDEVEIRDPVFERDADKNWKVKSGLGKINLDSRRVDELVDKMSDLKCVRYLNVKMPAPKEYRLEGDKVPLKIEFVMNDAKDKDGKDVKTKHWITIGARQEKEGPYYGTSSAMPGMVFLVPAAIVEPLISGNTAYFSKQ